MHSYAFEQKVDAQKKPNSKLFVVDRTILFVQEVLLPIKTACPHKKGHVTTRANCFLYLCGCGEAHRPIILQLTLAGFSIRGRVHAT